MIITDTKTALFNTELHTFDNKTERARVKHEGGVFDKD
jgi:hypothetical protein